MKLTGSHTLIIELENSDILTFKSIIEKITLESKQAGFKKLILTQAEQDLIDDIKEYLVE